MDKLETILSELKSAVNSPNVYLVTYFEDIRNQIDVECQICLNRQDLEMTAKEQAIQQQQEMINEVDLFETQCLSNLQKIPRGLWDLEELNSRFKRRNSLKKLEKDIYSQLHERKKMIFMNKGILYFDRKNSQKFCKTQTLTRTILFGSLYIIEDELLLFGDRLQKILNHQISDDWCNDSLKLLLMGKSLENSFFHDDALKVVNRIQLNMKEQKELILREEFCLDEMLLKDWLIELRALKTLKLNKCNLKRIHPTTFQPLVHLEVLDLAENSINKLDQGVFNSNVNLRVLNLSENKLTSLDRSILQNLQKLTQLNLSFNLLSLIPGGLFQGVLSLKTLYLRDNKLCSLDTNIFKGLLNLTQLNLNLNKINHVQCGLFQDLSSLKLLNLSENQIDFMDKNAFRGLKSLTELYLYNNSIKVLVDGLFQDLVSLEYLFLERNQLNFVDRTGCEKGSSAFKGLKSLGMLNLNNNAMSLIPCGLFEDLASLKLLNLSENRINFMDKNGCQQGEDILRGLENLIELRLNSNCICVFPDGLFKDLVNLKFCDLEDNRIGTGKVNSLKKIYGERIRI